MRGVSAVIHLAGCTTDAGIEEQISGNIVGAYNIYEAARAAAWNALFSPARIMSLGYYPRRRRLNSDALVRPDSRYGLTKAFGEQAGALFADKYGLRMLCIRIGYVDDKPIDHRRLSIWISWRDLAQLVNIGLSHPSLRYAVVYGVSDNARSFFDNDVAHRLGYRPRGSGGGSCGQKCSPPSRRKMKPGWEPTSSAATSPMASMRGRLTGFRSGEPCAMP